MLTIKKGMTRNQLLTTFTPQGGVYSAKERQFMSRDCGYFKVNVTFRRAAMNSQINQGESDEMDDDVITSISVPFLGRMIFD